MNVGVIGLGFMGATHLATLLKLPGVAVKAAASRNERALGGDFSSIGGNLGRILPAVDLRGVRKYAGWQDVVADPDVHAVDICLPTNFHSVVAEAALAAGKHVLCEKPMALDGAQCDAMIGAARSANRVLMIGHVLRFWPAYERLFPFVTSGQYGPVHAATFTRTCGLPEWSPWLADEAQSGGAILDLLIHDIDQILVLFGPPAGVRAKALGSFDAITASFLYPNGPEVRLQGGWVAAGTPFSMSFQVRATAAQLELRSDALLLSDAVGKQHVMELEAVDPYTAELSYFQQCCDANAFPDRCPPEQSAAAVRVANALKRSRSLDGEEIRLES